MFLTMIFFPLFLPGLLDYVYNNYIFLSLLLPYLLNYVFNNDIYILSFSCLIY